MNVSTILRHASVCSTYPGMSVRKSVGWLVILLDFHLVSVVDMVADMAANKKKRSWPRLGRQGGRHGEVYWVEAV